MFRPSAWRSTLDFNGSEQSIHLSGLSWAELRHILRNKCKHWQGIREWTTFFCDVYATEPYVNLYRCYRELIAEIFRLYFMDFTNKLEEACLWFKLASCSISAANRGSYHQEINDSLFDFCLFRRQCQQWGFCVEIADPDSIDDAHLPWSHGQPSSLLISRPRKM